MHSLREFYEAEAKVKEHGRDPNVKLRTRIIKRLVEGNLILDAGCGDGIHLKELSRIGNVFGIDLSTERLKRAGGNVVCADVYFIPFRDKTFEAVYSSEVLEHLEDPQRAVKEMERVLKNKGIVVISVPYREKIEKVVCTHCKKSFYLHGHLNSFDEVTTKGLSNMGIEKEIKAISKIVFNSFSDGIPGSLKYALDKIATFFVPNSARYLFVKFRKGE